MKKEIIDDNIEGMSLREYFATKGIILLKSSVTDEDEYNAHTIAEYAYKMANAMLEVRNK